MSKSAYDINPSEISQQEGLQTKLDILESIKSEWISKDYDNIEYPEFAQQNNIEDGYIASVSTNHPENPPWKALNEQVGEKQ